MVISNNKHLAYNKRETINVALKLLLRHQLTAKKTMKIKANYKK